MYAKHHGRFAPVSDGRSFQNSGKAPKAVAATPRCLQLRVTSLQSVFDVGVHMPGGAWACGRRLSELPEFWKGTARETGARITMWVWRKCEISGEGNDRICFRWPACDRNPPDSPRSAGRMKFGRRRRAGPGVYRRAEDVPWLWSARAKVAGCARPGSFVTVDLHCGEAMQYSLPASYLKP